MSIIKRISATITSTVDSAVRKVENHDAIINVSLKDTQTAAARTRVRLARVQKDGNQLKRRQQELKLAVTRWAERAKSTAATDEAKALECLRRRNECQQQARNLEDSLAQHLVLENRITENLKKIEHRISEVSQQRNMMRSRQSAADAMRVINNIDSGTCSEIEETFDRWEVNLGETEIMLGSNMVIDALDTEFAVEEDESALRAELTLLLSAPKDEQ